MILRKDFRTDFRNWLAYFNGEKAVFFNPSKNTIIMTRKSNFIYNPEAPELTGTLKFICGKP